MRSNLQFKDFMEIVTSAGSDEQLTFARSMYGGEVGAIQLMRGQYNEQFKNVSRVPTHSIDQVLQTYASYLGESVLPDLHCVYCGTTFDLVQDHMAHYSKYTLPQQGLMPEGAIRVIDAHNMMASIGAKIKKTYTKWTIYDNDVELPRASEYRGWYSSCCSSWTKRWEAKKWDQ